MPKEKTQDEIPDDLDFDINLMEKALGSPSMLSQLHMRTKPQTPESQPLQSPQKPQPKK
jgi:hypothetical protein